ncbi:PREDICTED: uncharacterized protein LOC105966476 [Erythranthe guttata]|uniref:uncharacterized protein LOC105966476 n=1 Tax=Erythranthe guttata TaxID=4155 RepID=UPI00064D9BA8|nr:PREDICTED: uncharacterized protein LOC105966476 [Erythranthe guttata]|eukprot:XP_012846485.1 PREDICTED: uncharacterized protein LOC105966476 [Erythranthe guttata]
MDTDSPIVFVVCKERGEGLSQIMSHCGFGENHAREVLGYGAIDPRLEEVIRALPLIGRDVDGLFFAEKEIGETEAACGDGEEVAPLLIIRIFNIQCHRIKGFDVRYSLSKMKRVGNHGRCWYFVGHGG